jgi:hypothetical protein
MDETTTVKTRKYDNNRYGIIFTKHEGVPATLLPRRFSYEEKKEIEKQFKETGSITYHDFLLGETTISPFTLSAFEMKSYHTKGDVF